MHVKIIVIAKQLFKLKPSQREVSFNLHASLVEKLQTSDKIILIQ